MSEIEQQIEEVLEQIRPSLRLDGGGIELVNYDEESATARVRMKGACAGCPMVEITLKMGVKSALQDALPQIKEVICVE